MITIVCDLGHPDCYKPHRVLETEASLLGLLPGSWPDPLVLDGCRLQRFNVVYGQDGGDVMFVDYQRPDGDTLRVYNS